MRLDEYLLTLAGSNLKNPIIRFYGWEKPTISLGFHQKINQDINIEECKKAGIDIVVRPTGGRAILHKDELTYSVVVPKNHPLSNLALVESYKQINSAISLGLRKLGVNCEISSGEKGINLAKNPSCFSSTSKYELSFAGRKIAGSAQRRLKGGFLQQGSILLDNGYLFLEKFIITDKKGELKQKSMTIKEILGYIPPLDEVISCIVNGFKEQFNINLIRIEIDKYGRIYEHDKEYLG